MPSIKEIKVVEIVGRKTTLAFLFDNGLQQSAVFDHASDPNEIAFKLEALAINIRRENHLMGESNASNKD